MCHRHQHPRHCPLVIIPRYIRIHDIGLWPPSTTIVGHDQWANCHNTDFPCFTAHCVPSYYNNTNDILYYIIILFTIYYFMHANRPFYLHRNHCVCILQWSTIRHTYSSTKRPIKIIIIIIMCGLCSRYNSVDEMRGHNIILLCCIRIANTVEKGQVSQVHFSSFLRNNQITYEESI